MFLLPLQGVFMANRLTATGTKEPFGFKVLAAMTLPPGYALLAVRYVLGVARCSAAGKSVRC